MYNSSEFDRGQPDAVPCWDSALAYPSALCETTTLIPNPMGASGGPPQSQGRGRKHCRTGESKILNPEAYTPHQEDLFVVGFDGESVVARLDRLVVGAGFSASG